MPLGCFFLLAELFMLTGGWNLTFGLVGEMRKSRSVFLSSETLSESLSLRLRLDSVLTVLTGWQSDYSSLSVNGMNLYSV